MKIQVERAHGVGAYAVEGQPDMVKLRIISELPSASINRTFEFILTKNQSRAVVTAMLSHYALSGDERAKMAFSFLCGKSE